MHALFRKALSNEAKHRVVAFWDELITSGDPLAIWDESITYGDLFPLWDESTISGDPLTIWDESVISTHAVLGASE